MEGGEGKNAPRSFPAQKLAMASCQEGRHHGFSCWRLLKNRSVFVSTLWAHEEKGKTAEINYLRSSAAEKRQEVHGQERPLCESVRLREKTISLPRFPVG